jgi:hypothetical protein
MRRLKGLSAALAALALVGCGAAGEERQAPAALVSATTAKAAAAEKVAPKAPDASEDLVKACRALAAAKTFRAQMTTTGDDGEKIETRTEAALPDRFYVSNADYELVIIGSEVYRKLPGGDWQTSPTGLAVTSLTDPKKLKEYLKTARVTPAGTETLDGAQVHTRHPRPLPDEDLGRQLRRATAQARRHARQHEGQDGHHLLRFQREALGQKTDRPQVTDTATAARRRAASA